MKKSFLIVLALVLTASFAMAKEKVTTIKGEAASVDPAAKTLTVKEKDKEVTLNVTDQTKIKIGKEKKGLADIKSGDKITARTTEKDGKTVAKAIWVSAGGAHEKSKTMKEEKK